MDTNQNYSSVIQDELTQKYNRNFEIVNLYYEVDGANGGYYRAICREAGDTSQFVAYYYLKNTDHFNLNTARSTDGEYVLVDDFCNLLMNKKYAGYLSGFCTEALHIVTESVTKQEITLTDIEKDESLFDFKNHPNIKIKAYFFVPGSIENKDAYGIALANKIAELGVERSVLNLIFTDLKSTAEIKAKYKNDTYMLDNNFNQDNNIVYYLRYFTEASNGIVSEKCVKGE